MHALSNAALDTPWPKVARGRALFRSVLDADVARGEVPSAASRRRLALELLDQLLSDKQRAPLDALPQTSVEPGFEAMLSSICVSQTAADRLPHERGYGTVAQTVVLIGRDGRSTLVERRMRDGATVGAPAWFEFEFGGRQQRGTLLAKTRAVVGRSAMPGSRWKLGLAVGAAAACAAARLASYHRSR
jgi:hypothetical protein